MTVKGSGTKPHDNRKKADGTASGVFELKKSYHQLNYLLD